MSKSLFDHITQFCQVHTLLPDGCRVVLGLSGGPDSVFLFHYLRKLHADKKIDLIVAHLDHQWRKNSSEDARFCKELADRYAIAYVQASLKDLEPIYNYTGSQEEIGRKYRRSFLQKVAREYSADRIALAHHKDDQHETFFLRLIRGSSLTGLVGMKPKDGLYIRPLLNTSKESILDYLNSHSLPYVIDPSNVSDEYLRNRIRNTIIPACKSVDSRFEKNMDATLARLTQAEDYLQEVTKETFEKITFEKDNTLWIMIDELLSLHPELRYRVIVHWLISENLPFTPSQSFFDEIVRFLHMPSSKSHTIAPGWTIKKVKRTATITK